MLSYQVSHENHNDEFSLIRAHNELKSFCMSYAAKWTKAMKGPTRTAGVLRVIQWMRVIHSSIHHQL